MKKTKKHTPPGDSKERSFFLLVVAFLESVAVAAIGYLATKIISSTEMGNAIFALSCVIGGIRLAYALGFHLGWNKNKWKSNLSALVVLIFLIPFMPPKEVVDITSERADLSFNTRMAHPLSCLTTYRELYLRVGSLRMVNKEFTHLE